MQIKVNYGSSVKDSFASEIVRLSPPDLHTLSFKGAELLETFVLSPLGSCPGLKTLDLAGCKKLKYVLIQSDSLETINLSLCVTLKKLIIHARNAAKIDLRDLIDLQEVIIWSDMVDDLDMSLSKKITRIDLHCPVLSFPKIGRVLPKPPPHAPKHDPVVELLVRRFNKEISTNNQRSLSVC